VLYYSLILSLNLNLSLQTPCFNLRYLLWSLVKFKVVPTREFADLNRASLYLSQFRDPGNWTEQYDLCCVPYGFHCVSGLLQGSVVIYRMSLVPAGRPLMARSLCSGHKWFTFHQSSKYTWPLSVPPEVFPSHFDTGRKVD
jgi:hypothetical protein